MTFLLLLTLFTVLVSEGCVGKTAQNITTQGRIQYGKPTKKGTYLYFVRLEIVDKRGEEFTCGGFLYRRNIVVTAAHCVSDDDNRINVKRIRVYSNGDGGLEGRSPVDVSGYRIPSNWGKEDLKGDVMVLKLSKSFNTKTIGLAKKLPKPGVQLLIIGVGSTENDETEYDYEYEYEEDSRLAQSSDREFRSEYTLLEAKVPMLPRKDSNSFAIESGGPAMETDHFGAGYDKEHQDACVGDSGGPIIQHMKTTGGFTYPVVVGVVSYGYTKCGDKNAIGYYTSIPYYRRWIEETTAKGTWVRL